MSRAWAGVGVLSLAVLTCGCGKKPAAEEVDIAGRLEDAAGKPLPRMIVHFYALDEANKHARAWTCATQAGGDFKGRCLPGRYKVTVAAVPLGTGTADPGSGTIADPGKAKGVAGVPKAYTSPDDTPLQVMIPDRGKTDIVLKVK